ISQLAIKKAWITTKAKYRRDMVEYPFSARRKTIQCDWQCLVCFVLRIQNSTAFSILYRAKFGPYNPALSRGYSSAGRALAWHARGQRFDPAYLHHEAKLRKSLSSRGLGHCPFTAVTGVRIPLGTPT